MRTQIFSGVMACGGGRRMRSDWVHEGNNTVYVGDKIVKEHATHLEAMDYIWSDMNTEEHPVRVIDENGVEIEW